jgi:hypothetical protein
MRKLRVPAVLLIAALFLAACSVSRLAYLNAPPLALFYIGGYVDMTDAQKKFARERLENAMAWHRKAELPQYQHSIEGLIVKVSVKVSADDARGIYRQARDYYNRAIEHLLPDIADFLLMLDERQAAQVEKKFAEDNAKLVKESVKGTVDDRRAARAKRYVEQFEDWTGTLSGPQRAIIINGVRPLEDVTDERIGDRKYRQSEVLHIIREKPSREAAVAKLRSILIETDTWRRPDYTKKLRDRDDRIIEIVSELTSTLTPEQRISVQRRMGNYVKDISSILASR